MSLQIDLIESSFAQICDRKSEFTDFFYSTLFADYPQVQPLFANTPMQDQGKKLFTSLVLVVNNLTQPQVLGDTLQAMGTRHVQYGTLPEYYPMVGSTLLKTLAFMLQDTWSTELAAAWSDAYAAITKIMLSAADPSSARLQDDEAAAGGTSVQ
ncbi:MAG: flavohemoprotein [Acaryochloris sp. SU_5_25]|nr:flavohemoprotein [Acaryochloris sp. SU_5_25]NJR54719.1 flavohemoprotein [Acaryochloris sp. CRU_2_0]